MSETELMPDIIEQMRQAAEELDHTDPVQKLLRRAATEVEHMRSQYVDRLEEIERLRRWLPIDSAPKDGTEILAWLVEGPRKYRAIAWFSIYSQRWRSHQVCHEPAAWQPLPSPPVPSQEGASDTGEQMSSLR